MLLCGAMGARESTSQSQAAFHICMKGNYRFLILGFIWAALVALGAHQALKFENTAGSSGIPQRRLPASLRTAAGNDAFVLVMLAHPNCPCTRASLTELERLLARARGKLATFVILSKPGASIEELRASPMSELAARIPGVSVIPQQVLATETFAGETSGTTLLYDPRGLLVYSGGITRARGHLGDNPGADAVLARVAERTQEFLHLPAFGCPLKDPSSVQLRDDPSWRKQ